MPQTSKVDVPSLFFVTHARIVIFIVATLFASSASAAGEKPLNNADVIKLIKSGMSEEVVLTVINSSEPGFDTSADGLIALKKQGASESVISAIVSSGSHQTSNTIATSAQPTSGGLPNALTLSAPASGPTDVTMVDNGKRIKLRYTDVDIQYRALGYGGTYFSLDGDAAAVRIKNKSPHFIVAVLSNQQPDIKLARWEPRKGGKRQIRVGSAFSGKMFDPPKDRLVSMKFTKLADQRGAVPGTELYQLTLDAPLQSGEYGISTISTLYVYDFGVD